MSRLTMSSLAVVALLGGAACGPITRGTGMGDGGVDGGEVSLYPVLPKARAKKVVVGNGMACALTTTGSIRCWGFPGDITESRTAFRFSIIGSVPAATMEFGSSNRVEQPVEVPGITDAVDIDVNYQHVCALTAAKKMKCWGQNDVGQVGNGTDLGVIGPVELTLSNVKKMGVGANFSCALLEDSSVKCWGSQAAGLTDVPVMLQSDRFSPLDVPYARGATDLFVGSEGVCVLLNGDVRCWGDNMPRAGGNELDPAPWRLPIATPTAMWIGRTVSCGIFAGAAKCWGRSDDGLLGNGAGFGDPMPPELQQVRGLTSGVTSITYGGAVANGKVYRWGPKWLGNTDDASVDKSLVPVEVRGLTNAVQVATSSNGSGSDLVCVVTSGGSVFCWGDGENGQLGIGTRDRHGTPQKVLTFE